MRSHLILTFRNASLPDLLRSSPCQLPMPPSVLFQDCSSP